jgi:hypothetical protein
MEIRRCKRLTWHIKQCSMIWNPTLVTEGYLIKINVQQSMSGNSYLRRTMLTNCKFASWISSELQIKIDTSHEQQICMSKVPFFKCTGNKKRILTHILRSWECFLQKWEIDIVKTKGKQGFCFLFLFFFFFSTIDIFNEIFSFVNGKT